MAKKKNTDENTETTTTTTEPKAEKQAIVFEDNWLATKAPAVLKNIQKLLDEIKQKKGSNIIAAIKATEEYAADCKGDTNTAKRVAWLAAGLNIDPNTIAQGKAGITALGTMLGNMYTGNPAGEGVNVEKKEKEEVITETETMLATTGLKSFDVSENVKGLSQQDVNTVQSAVHASFQTALKMLSTPKLPFPRAASDVVSVLIGASGGSTDWFSITDKMITESSGLSESTIKRARAKLIDWMTESGKGVVGIRQNSKKATEYKINLLASTSAIIHNLLTSEHADPENLLVVAGMTGKLLTEGTDKLRTQVSDDVLNAARNLNASITQAIDSLPKPQVKFTEQSKKSSADHTNKKFETFQNQLSEALEMADEAGNDKVSRALNQLSLQVRSAREAFEKDPESTVDWDSLEKPLSANLIVLKEEARGREEELQEQLAKEKEIGTVSADTRRGIAAANVDQFGSEERKAQEKEEAFEAFEFNVYLIAEIANRSGDAEAKKTAFLRAQDVLQKAFQYGQYAATATEV